MFTKKTNALLTFLLASISMGGLHTVSAAVGAAFPLLFGALVLKILAIVIFFIYGCTFMYEAIINKPEEEEESDDNKNYQNMDGEDKKSCCQKLFKNPYIYFMGGLIIAEMGDRS